MDTLHNMGNSMVDMADMVDNIDKGKVGIEDIK